MHNQAILFFILLTFGAATGLRAQHYSLYNSGTLAESVENPWVAVFGRYCKKVASNFFFPVVSGDGFFQGDAARASREYLFWGNKLPAPLEDEQARNRLYLNGRASVLSVKVLVDQPTGSEALFDHSVRSMNWARFKNISMNLAQGGSFIEKEYYGPEEGVANANAFHYMFTETSLGYRRKFGPDFSAGIKLSFLNGIAHMEGGTGYSEADYNRMTDQMALEVRGEALLSAYSSDMNAGYFLPGFRNPGFSISGGIEKRFGSTLKFTLGFKDLGKIRWKERGERILLEPGDVIEIEEFSLLSKSRAEEELNRIRAEYGRPAEYTTPLPARFEAGASMVVHPQYTASLVAGYLSKFERADLSLINDFSYGDFHLILNAGYNTYQNMQLGLNFLVRSPTVDFFIGSDNLLPTSRLIRSARREGYAYDSATGGNLNIGFALKLGYCEGSEDPHSSGWLHLRDRNGKRRKEKCFIF